MNELIVRIAARGDGVTASGRHVPFGVPGDAVLDDGALAFGPHHQEPPCRHFPECGGCQLQHADDEAYRGYLISRVETALAQHGLWTKIHEPHLSPPRTRRRATLRALRVGQGAVLGFNAEKSHRIVDMRECHIMRPELFALVEPLRRLLGGLLPPKRTAEVQLTLVDQGADVLLKGIEAKGLDATEALTAFGTEQRVARLSIDQGLGPETIFEPEPVTVPLAGRSGRRLPSGDAGRRSRSRRSGQGRRDRRNRRPVRRAWNLCAWHRRCLRRRSIAGSGGGAQAGSSRHDGRAPRPVPPPARRGRARALRLSDPRSATRRSRRAGRPARRLVSRSDRLGQLQPGHVRARREGAGRRRIQARMGAAGRPVPLVDARRTRRLLHPWWMRKIAAWMVRLIRQSELSANTANRTVTMFTVAWMRLCTILKPT